MFSLLLCCCLQPTPAMSSTQPVAAVPQAAAPRWPPRLHSAAQGGASPPPTALPQPLARLGGEKRTRVHAGELERGERTVRSGARSATALPVATLLSAVRA
ncbi:unnamed protein product [Urochloa humidicola]